MAGDVATRRKELRELIALIENQDRVSAADFDRARMMRAELYNLPKEA